MPSATPTDLQPVPLFGSLTDSDLAEIAPWFEVRDVGPGERLIGEGASGEHFFVISKGEVAVTGLGHRIASLGPGEFFGEIALLGYRQHIATVTASSQARFLVLSSDDFARLRTTYPGVAADIGAVMQTRLEQLP